MKRRIDDSGAAAFPERSDSFPVLVYGGILLKGRSSNNIMKTPLPKKAPSDISLPPMPPKPTLVDFFNLRFEEGQHTMQSAMRAMANGLPEEIVFACLLHDTGMALQMPDHGYVGAALYEPYVSEKVSWAIRYHQALRFFPDPAVGSEY
ncbi:MAG TPA: HD domain-containing protein, partial [Terriglobia bacterium]|nr:HD domain-containing protein [Terriglobia bacterium]